MNAKTEQVKHTPGPWVVDNDGSDDFDNMLYCMKSPDNTWIAVGIADENGYAESVAYTHPDNARLIAASPDLLEALKYLRLEVLHYWQTGVGLWFLIDRIKQAENAIAKAEGTEGRES